MILTPCPYDPIRSVQDAMILTPCPYDPIRSAQDAMILTPCPYDPIRSAQDAAGAIPAPKEPYWVVNYTQFLRHFRNNWIVEHIAHKLNKQSGEITKVLLDEFLLDERRQSANTPR